MKIDLIRVYKIVLPFQMDFSHSLSKGTSAENIVAEVIAEGGKIKGYGEGTPRKYVTGETQDEAVENIDTITHGNNFPWEFKEISSIWKLVDELPDEKSSNPAICALESALLDAWGIKQQLNLINFLPHNYYTSKIFYGGAFPLGNNQKLRELCLLIKEMKIKKIKLKMGEDLPANREALEIIRQVFDNDYDLKIDANGIWTADLARQHISLLKEYQVKVVEQPLAPDDPYLAGFAEALEANGILLMADESACSFNEVKKIIEEGYYKMINIRLSKLGGFRKCFKIIDFLRREKRFFQIGCHLGESGILSAAGRILGCLCRDSMYYDGSYDSFLLKRNITQENVSFGLGGEAGPLPGFGLGVKINETHLKQLTAGPVFQITR